MHALIVAAGDAPERAALDRSWPGWSDGVELVVAADAGADTAERLGIRPDLVVGDFDSIAPGGLDRLRAAGIPVEITPADKDESDTELAIRAALARGAGSLTIIGGLGGRPDHLIANLELLALSELADLPVQMVDDRTRVSLIQGPGARDLAGRIGDHVSLLPLGPGVEGVTTAGLAWPLNDEALPLGPARGLSNVRTTPVARVTVRAGLLFAVETIGGPAVN